MRCAYERARPTATRSSGSIPTFAPGQRRQGERITTYLGGEISMGGHSCRAAKLAAPVLLAAFSFATPAFAANSAISPADTAWMIVATALVLMMTIPGLA